MLLLDPLAVLLSGHARCGFIGFDLSVQIGVPLPLLLQLVLEELDLIQIGEAFEVQRLARAA
jgi:hypothetical protein